MMSYETQTALVDWTRAGCNINIINNLLNFVFNTSLEIGSALMYSYCVEYLLTEIF